MIIYKLIKNNIKKTISENFLSDMLDFIKSKILEQAKNQLSGCAKKENVDKAVIAFIKENIICTNPIINAIINVLVEYIPILTQCIYEYLKKYVDGLTEV